MAEQEENLGADPKVEASGESSDSHPYGVDAPSSTTPLPGRPGLGKRGLVSWFSDVWHSKNRPILILGILAVLVLAFGIVDALTASGPKAAKAVDSAPAVPQHAGMPGGSAPAPYQQAQAQENAVMAEKAEQQGKSYIPPMGQLQTPKIAPAKITLHPSAPTPPPAPMPVGNAPYPYQTAMDKEIRSIVKATEPVAALSANSTIALPGQPKIESAVGTTATTASAASAVKPQPVILAQPGHISFAVLDTSIKSTEPGPVMATIEDGRFAGAKLLGGFVRHAGRVVVEFNEMTLHHQSYPIQAVAITTDTARTALSTYTNYHVLYRYGWLIGSALLEGVTNALQYANTSTQITGSGVGIVTQQLSNGQIAASAIGNVGSVLAPIMEKRFDTPPTVHVKAGTGVGILFMKPVEEGGQP